MDLYFIRGIVMNSAEFKVLIGHSFLDVWHSWEKYRQLNTPSEFRYFIYKNNYMLKIGERIGLTIWSDNKGKYIIGLALFIKRINISEIIPICSDMSYLDSLIMNKCQKFNILRDIQTVILPIEK